MPEASNILPYKTLRTAGTNTDFCEERREMEPTKLLYIFIFSVQLLVHKL